MCSATRSGPPAPPRCRIVGSVRPAGDPPDIPPKSGPHHRPTSPRSAARSVLGRRVEDPGHVDVTDNPVGTLSVENHGVMDGTGLVPSDGVVRDVVAARPCRGLRGADAFGLLVDDIPQRLDARSGPPRPCRARRQIALSSESVRRRIRYRSSGATGRRGSRRGTMPTSSFAPATSRPVESCAVPGQGSDDPAALRPAAACWRSHLARAAAS